MLCCILFRTLRGPDAVAFKRYFRPIFLPFFIWQARPRVRVVRKPSRVSLKERSRIDSHTLGLQTPRQARAVSIAAVPLVKWRKGVLCKNHYLWKMPGFGTKVLCASFSQFAELQVGYRQFASHSNTVGAAALAAALQKNMLEILQEGPQRACEWVCYKQVCVQFVELAYAEKSLAIRV